MQNMFGPVLIVIVAILFFSTIFGICYLYFTSRTRERLALVERGLDPNFFRPRRTALKYGMVIFSVLLGMTIGDFIPWRYAIGVPLGVMFGGLSLIAYYFIIDKRLGDRDEA
ncbi:DUF6249 domain-containing protein [Adhaeribacter radiodurans]|uniref:DUF6249 domain-containing protein n=1 Tax=Adhaeribacter radiodurans TaxID=2745197 RepID=A0A7L7LEC9_9BACT|nr:DUF6249 domain-containing protein [Adhaeribacter radiodurans]QMU31171.1 hypothetical protein HUW48_25485 [Adhaeribacter radiodurans]